MTPVISESAHTPLHPAAMTLARLEGSISKIGISSCGKNFNSSKFSDRLCHD